MKVFFWRRPKHRNPFRVEAPQPVLRVGKTYVSPITGETDTRK